MIPEDEVGLIVAGDIEGALRYNSLVKSPYIYKIKANNIRGVSLKDNLMQNHDGLREFLREPLEKKYETLDSLAEDTNGAIYLDEIHLYKSDINVENISIVPKEEMEISLTDGPWKNHF
ncbi:hypothetical protein [Pectobacterium carotovorum]|uniref:Uncharacterized protein n=1 Tax=Pectobacterium carotovorum TaxID=554 RepID=A0A419AR20_PECCA|nr:hypothetical protein [Pectobacterium carotovorum]RJL46789.1 hypothetical protein D5071_20215 [Pectobacterium carotovorum]